MSQLQNLAGSSKYCFANTVNLDILLFPHTHLLYDIGKNKILDAALENTWLKIIE